MNTVTRTFLLAAMLGAAGCGGSKGQSGAPIVPSNAPEWVHRGSRVQSGSIFGLGSVAGIKDPALARNTAGNRARNEIAKIMETYSASLMKDYSASTSAGGKTSEEQHVEQAVKTFTAQLLTGVEVKDVWLDAPKNTWYAVAELNFERQREVAAAQAQMGPGLQDWLNKNGGRLLADLEGSMRGQPPRVGTEDPPAASAPPPAAQAPKAAPPAAPVVSAAEEGPPAKVGGPAPGWTTGQCDRQRFLCGVGEGRDRKTADVDARAELAKIFSANIQSVAKSYEGAASTISSKTGERWIETSSFSQFSMVSTDKVVTMSQIHDRWTDGKARFVSLAVIDRAQASAALRDKIQEKDGIVTARLAAARGAQDNLAKLKALKAAVQAMAEREAANADLRVINGTGQGIPPPVAMGELLALLEGTAGELRLGVAMAGAGAERVRDCLEQALTAKGYQVEANVDEDEESVDISGDFDVLIKGKIRAEKRGPIAGSEVVQTTLTLQLINGKTKKVVRTFTGSEKGSRGTIKEAASTSAFKICQKQVPEMVSEIDRSFGR